MNISSLDSVRAQGNLLGIAKHFDSEEAQNKQVSSMEKHVHCKKIIEKIRRLDGADKEAVDRCAQAIIIAPESDDGSDYNKSVLSNGPELKSDKLQSTG